MNGTRAMITVWDPSLVNITGDFSLSEIWVTAGGGSGPILNTIETGWQVYPGRTGDAKPKTFYILDGRRDKCVVVVCRWNSGGILAGKLFVALRDGADTIIWGGEIFDSSGSGGFHTLTQMGSGHLAGEGYGKASHVRHFMYYDSSGQTVSLTQNDLVGYAPAPDCYNYEYDNSSSELYFFYGGPGCT
ncbi:hypothetical protein Nepgr_017840 [Nepenthes gracilis]|uniref:Neprosin PEP catalytic domain-containing protein n=1 Tax=Nepenthes gracilis TaxID=150966 RepID=A0AAD3SSE7_NEPGR|nr:hypothetical protein Nepgr_017840 [Nepenthes gracilis]